MEATGSVAAVSVPVEKAVAGGVEKTPVEILDGLVVQYAEANLNDLKPTPSSVRGQFWRQVMNIRSNEPKTNEVIRNLPLYNEIINVVPIEKKTQFDDQTLQIIKTINTNPEYRGFIDADFGSEKIIDTKSIEDLKRRITSFYKMIGEQIVDGGFFVCQEDDYINLFKLINEVEQEVEQKTGGAIENPLIMPPNIGHIHVTKLAKFGAPKPGKTPDDAAATTSATLFMAGLIKSGTPEYNAIKDKIKLNNKKYGDGVTIYYDKEKWMLEPNYKYTPGNTKNYADEFIGSMLHYEPAVPPLGDAIVKLATSPFIIAEFTRKDDGSKIVIATSHLESGDIYKKLGTSGDDKDINRSTHTKIFLDIIDTFDANIPKIIGMDGNSSAGKNHTAVMDLLETKGFTTAIDDHNTYCIKFKKTWIRDNATMET